MGVGKETRILGNLYPGHARDALRRHHRVLREWIGEAEIMKSLYKWYPWVAIGVVVVCGITAPVVGLALLVIIVLTFMFFNIKITVEPRWGKKPEVEVGGKQPVKQKEKKGVMTTPKQRLKHMKDVMNKEGVPTAPAEKGKKANASTNKGRSND